MDIHVSGSRPTRRAPADSFTGTVLQDPIIATEGPARLVSNRVAFEPGARTAWHTHPLGQTLIVTAGCGWTQCEGGPIVEIKPGDVIWCPPGHKHWHGATPTTAMTLRPTLIEIACPSGFWPGHNLRASVSLTTATSSLEARSLSVNSLPIRSGTPAASKYPSLTTRMYASG